MPELPDLVVFEDRLRDAALGRTVGEVEIRDASLVEDVRPEELRDRVRGSPVEDTRRHGKNLFARMDGGGWLRFHFGMTGFLQGVDDREDVPDHTHILFLLEGGGGVAFSCQRKLGAVGWVEDPEAWIREKGLGPDPMRDGFGEEDFLAALEGRRGMVKSALMNQEILAGIGNECSDEILFRLGMHPRTRLPWLDDDRRKELWAATREVLEAGAVARMDPERMPGDWLLRARALGEEERCPRCGTEIERVKVSGRNARYCPRCQGEEP